MKIKGFFLLIFLMGISGYVIAASSPELKNLEQISTQESGVRDDFLAFPRDVQEAMTEAAQSPSVLNRLQQIQSRTSRQFREKIEGLSRKTQEKIYTLTRYPNLMARVAETDSPKKEELKKIGEGYPKEVQAAVMDLGRHEGPVLRDIQGLYNNSQREFDSLLSPLPLSTQTAYRRLLQVPEAINLLQKNPEFTAALGEAQRKSPGALASTLEVWNQEYEVEKTDAAESFQQDLKNNPKTQKELTEAAQVYARENSLEVYETVPQETSVTNVYVNVNPYPYWFGYPYWAPYAYWRPYPYWYYTGFYFGVGFAPFFVGFPNYYYSSWYFGSGGYYYQYPYLSRYYWNQYYRSRYAYPYRYPGFRRAVSSRARYYPEGAHYGRAYEGKYLQQSGTSHVSEPRSRSSLHNTSTPASLRKRGQGSSVPATPSGTRQRSRESLHTSPSSSGGEGVSATPQRVRQPATISPTSGSQNSSGASPYSESSSGRSRSISSPSSISGTGSSGRSGISSGSSPSGFRSGSMGSSGGFRGGSGGGGGMGRSGGGRR